MSQPQTPRPEDRNLRPAEPPPLGAPYRSEGFYEDLPPAPVQH